MIDHLNGFISFLLQHEVGILITVLVATGAAWLYAEHSN